MLKIPEVPEELAEEYRLLLSDIRTSHLKNNDLIAKIYQYLNKLNEFVKTFTVCSRTCGAFCCYIPVSMTYIEAKYISINKNIKMNDKLINPLNNINKSLHNKYSNKCPFLNAQNDCSIYNSRPFNCRTFHTIDDPSYCKTTKSHYIFGAPSVKDTTFGIIIDYHSNILTGLYRIILDYNKNLPFNDIREFFLSP